MADITYNSEEHDYYAILGIGPTNVDATALKTAYKRLLFKLHPDKHPVYARAEAHERFTRMQNAYEIVKEPATRRKYNSKRNKYYRTLYKQRNFACTFDEYMQWVEGPTSVASV
jgi:curved DNA-binding protein CbpA